MNSIISSFSLGKDISYDVLSWNLHGTETMSRPLSEARAGALTWDPFRATNRLQITNNPPSPTVHHLSGRAAGFTIVAGRKESGHSRKVPDFKGFSARMLYHVFVSNRSTRFPPSEAN